MAYIRASQGGGGEEVLLWENSGTSDPANPISLSDSKDNYSKIRIDWLPINTESNVVTTIVPSNLIQDNYLSNGTISLYTVYSSGGRGRYVYTASGQHDKIYLTSSLTNCCIPIKIYGIK